MENYVEQIIEAKPNGASYAKVVVAGIITAIGAVITLMTIYIGWGLLLVCAGGYLIYYTKNCLNFEYEYEITNGDVSIDKIINNYINIFNNIILLDNNINNNNIKYLNGWSIILKGKLSNDRSKTYNLIYGSFNNNKSYKLNYIPNNLYNGIINPLNLNINKDGKYNIKVKLNYSS